MHSFDDFGLDAALRTGLAALNFAQPTPIQSAALPFAGGTRSDRAGTHWQWQDGCPQLLLSRNVLKQLEPLIQDNERAAALLANAQNMVSDAYAQMRDIIKNTRIEVIDSIGFTAALESMVTHYTSVCDKPAIILDHNLPKRPELPEAVVVSAYKIIREALFNAIKHASANQVRVSVQYSKALGLYKVEVTDDGVGIKASPKSEDSAGIGLIDMRERARVLGGKLKVQCADTANPKRPGTRVRFSFSGRSS